MKRNKLIKVLLGLAAFVLLVDMLSIALLGPWAGGRMQTLFAGKNDDYKAEIGKVRVLLIPFRVSISDITLQPGKEPGGKRIVKGEIASVKIVGINLVKALVRKDIAIRKVTISRSRIMGLIIASKGVKKPLVLHVNIRIGRLALHTTDLAMKSVSDAQAYSVKGGSFIVDDLEIKEQDTVSVALFKQFEFKADELVSVSGDSLYTYAVSGIDYSTHLKILTINSLSVHPNYRDYAFTARNKYQTDRFEAGVKKISARDFDPADYFKSRNLKSSYVEIGKLDMNIFRDKRKPFRHVTKPAFQEMIYNLHGTIHIDSIRLDDGNVTYIEHAEEAIEPGSISLNELHFRIYRITNDPVYKTKDGFMELKGDALLMGKGKMSLSLKAKIFDRQNTFTLDGTLAGMEVTKLNPMLENTAFVKVTSGTADAMNFNFTANNTKATGRMTFRYHDLGIAVVNKKTRETTAFRERFVSSIANWKVLDTNPEPGKEVRVGLIEYDRNPEKFFINYCIKSILTGIKSSLVKSTGGKNG